MSFTRRAFFRAMPAAGLAARAAIEQVRTAALNKAGMSLEGSVGVAAHPYPEPFVASSSGNYHSLAGRMLAAFFRKKGLPDWKRRQLYRAARESRLLDPDIAALRSISPGMMLRMQWERNEKRMVELYYNRFEDEEDRRAFEEANGTDYLG